MTLYWMTRARDLVGREFTYALWHMCTIHSSIALADAAFTYTKINKILKVRSLLSV